MEGNPDAGVRPGTKNEIRPRLRRGEPKAGGKKKKLTSHFPPNREPSRSRGEAGAIDQVEADVFGEEVAQRVEVAGVEAVGIGAQTVALGGAQDARCSLGRGDQGAQARTSPVQGRLHRGEADAEDGDRLT